VSATGGIVVGVGTGGLGVTTDVGLGPGSLTTAAAEIVAWPAVVVCPTGLLTVTPKVESAATAGTPLIIPVDALRVIPEGSEPELTE